MHGSLRLPSFVYVLCCVFLDDTRVFLVQVVIVRKHVLGGGIDLRMIIAHASPVFSHAFPEIPIASSFTGVRLQSLQVDLYNSPDFRDGSVASFNRCWMVHFHDRGNCTARISSFDKICVIVWLVPSTNGMLAVVVLRLSASLSGRHDHAAHFSSSSGVKFPRLLRSRL